MAAIDPKILVAFELMLGGVDGAERKGVNVPYVAVNGNMYAMISKRDAIGIIVAEQHWRSFELAGGTPFAFRQWLGSRYARKPLPDPHGSCRW